MGTRTRQLRRPSAVVLAAGVLILGTMVLGITFVNPPAARAAVLDASVTSTGGVSVDGGTDTGGDSGSTGDYSESDSGTDGAGKGTPR